MSVFLQLSEAVERLSVALTVIETMPYPEACANYPAALVAQGDEIRKIAHDALRDFYKIMDKE